MQLTISFPDILPNKKLLHIIKTLEHFLKTEGISAKIEHESSSNDAWDNLDIDKVAVDTGIEDFAENHDYYLYGT